MLFIVTFFFLTLERKTIIWIWLYSGSLAWRNAGRSSQNCWCHYLQIILHWHFVFRTQLRDYVFVPFCTQLSKRFSGFVQCEIELDQNQNKLHQDIIQQNGNVKQHVTWISQMSLSGSQIQTSTWHWWYKSSSRLVPLGFISSCHKKIFHLI